MIVTKSKEPYWVWNNWISAFGWKEIAISLSGSGHRTVNVAVRTTEHHNFVVHGLWWSSRFWSITSQASRQSQPLPEHHPEMVVVPGADDNDWLRDFLQKVFAFSIGDYQEILQRVFLATYPHRLTYMPLGVARRTHGLNLWLRDMDTGEFPPDTVVTIFQVGDTSYTPKAVKMNGMIQVSRDWDNLHLYRVLSAEAKHP